MRSLPRLLLATAGLILTPGCGSDDKPAPPPATDSHATDSHAAAVDADSVMEERIKTMNRLSQAIEERAPAKELARLERDVNKTAVRVGELPVEERRRVLGEYRDEFEAAADRLMKARFGRGFEPGGN